jgi:hypothetical protein
VGIVCGLEIADSTGSAEPAEFPATALNFADQISSCSYRTDSDTP